MDGWLLWLLTAADCCWLLLLAGWLRGDAFHNGVGIARMAPLYVKHFSLISKNDWACVYIAVISCTPWCIDHAAFVWLSFFPYATPR